MFFDSYKRKRLWNRRADNCQKRYRHSRTFQAEDDWTLWTLKWALHLILLGAAFLLRPLLNCLIVANTQIYIYVHLVVCSVFWALFLWWSGEKAALLYSTKGDPIDFGASPVAIIKKHRLPFCWRFFVDLCMFYVNDFHGFECFTANRIVICRTERYGVQMIINNAAAFVGWATQLFMLYIIYAAEAKMTKKRPHEMHRKRLLPFLHQRPTTL